MNSQVDFPSVSTAESAGLREGLIALLQAQAEGWELPNYEIRTPDDDGNYVQLSWMDDEGIGRAIALEIAISYEIRTPHVSVGTGTAFYANAEDGNIWRQSHYEHGGFATSPLKALVLVNQLYAVVSGWTRQDILANRLPTRAELELAELVAYPFAEL